MANKIAELNLHVERFAFWVVDSRSPPNVLVIEITAYHEPGAQAVQEHFKVLVPDRVPWRALGSSC